MGKARVFGSYAEEEIGLLRNKVAAYALIRNPPNAVGTTYLTSQVGLTPIEQSGLQIDRTKMPRTGGVFSGSVGFELGTTRLVTGTQTIDLLKTNTGGENDKLYGDFVVSLDSGTTGTLTTLLGASKDGMRVRLYGIATNTVTITHTAAATTNTITCPNNTDFIWNTDEVVDLVRDLVSGKWILTTGTGVKIVDFPITPTIKDLGNVSGITDIDLNDANSHIHKMTLIGNTTLTFSNPPASGTQIEFELEISQDATGGRTLTYPASVRVDPTMPSGANDRAIFVGRTNDAGTNYDLVAGGGGTITFPITPTVDDREATWTGTQNIDLSLVKAHVTKFILDQNLTLTLSNIPTDETQIEFEIEVLQDATGGWTVTFPTEVVEDITISSAANTLTIVTLRVNDGVNVHAITTLAGVISGGSGFANTALSNLTSPTAINQDLIMGNNDVTAIGNIIFGTSGVNIPASPTIWADPSGDMVLNVADLDTLFLTFEGVTKYSFIKTDADFRGNTLTDVGVITPTGATGTTDFGKVGNLWKDIWAIRMRFTTAVSIDLATATITINGGTGVSVDLRSNNATQMQLLSGGGIDIFTNMNFSSGNIDLNAGDLTIGVTATTGGLINFEKFGKVRWLDNAGTGFIQINMDTNDVLNLSNSVGSASMFLQGFYSMFESSDPTTVADTGYVYCKDVAGDTHLFFDNFTQSPLDLSVGAGLPFDDNQTIIQDEIDNSKTLTFNLTLQSTGAANLLSWAVGGSRTHTFSATTGTLAQLNLAQSWTSTQTYNAITNFNSSVALGNDAGDLISFNGRINTDLIPVDALQNMGSTALPWNSLVLDNTLFCTNLKAFDTDTDINVFKDLDMQSGATIDWNGNETATSATAGINGDVPAQVVGYIIMKVDAVNRKIPFYAT